MAPQVPCLMVITDATGRGLAATSEMVAELGRGAPPGSILFQVRDRELPDAMRFALCQELRAITRAHSQWLSINDRSDWALLVGAEGVHLPANGPAPSRVRGLFRERGRRVFLSRAFHEAGSPLSDVDAAVLSPVFAARKGRSPIGLDAVLQAREREPSVHCFALGGVGATEAENCFSAGVRVAVMGAAYTETTQLIRAVSKF